MTWAFPVLAAAVAAAAAPPALAPTVVDVASAALRASTILAALAKVRRDALEQIGDRTTTAPHILDRVRELRGATLRAVNALWGVAHDVGEQCPVDLGALAQVLFESEALEGPSDNERWAEQFRSWALLIVPELGKEKGGQL